MFNSASCELYIGNLDKEVTEEILFSLFSRYGNIQLLKIMRHLITHKSRGFGFITYRSRHESTKAQKDMHGVKIMKNNIKVYLKEQFDNLDPQANIVITDFPANISDEELVTLTEIYGPVFSAKVVQVDEGESKTGKKAYVQFETVDTAKKALEALHGNELKGHIILVEQAGKKNKLFLKVDYSENIIDQLRLLMSAWEPLEFGNLELSNDKLQCIVPVKLENDLQARAFLQDFNGDKAKCYINRPVD